MYDVALYNEEDVAQPLHLCLTLGLPPRLTLGVGQSHDKAASTAREAELEAELARERKARRELEAELAKAKAGPKSAKAPIDPDSEIARLKLTIKELRARLREATISAVIRQTGISDATYRALYKAMHPDSMPKRGDLSLEDYVARLEAKLPQVAEALALLNAHRDEDKRRGR